MTLSIIGTGTMAKSLIKGLINTFDIEVIGRDDNKLTLIKNEFKTIKTHLLHDNQDITNKLIILCVKPYALNSVARALTGKASLLISILAGTTLETLKKEISSNHYIRTMPNIAASIQESTTTITGDKEAKQIAIKIFDKVGLTLWVDTQKRLDIATAIAGSGPAFLALIAESLTDGGVKAGLEREYCSKLVQGLFNSVAKLLDKKNPSIIKNEVMSPAGTTAAGYATLEEAGVRNAMIKAIEASYNKAIELSQK